MDPWSYRRPRALAGRLLYWHVVECSLVSPEVSHRGFDLENSAIAGYHRNRRADAAPAVCNAIAAIATVAEARS